MNIEGDEIMVNISGLVQSPPTALPLPTTNQQMTEAVTNISLQFWDSIDFSQVLSKSDCQYWAPFQHIFFQLAHFGLVLSCLAPVGTIGLLCLRAFLLVAFALYSAWGFSVACSLDTALWGLLLTLINLCWVTGLAWRVRPVKLDVDMEEVYSQLFLPLKVSRTQFQKLLEGTKERRLVGAKEFVIEEKVSRVNSLSLVLSGRLLVSQAGRPLHVVSENQFLDSPEWFGVTTDEYFQVSVTALEECSILVWHRDRLKFHLMADSFLQVVFDHVLGRDVVKKLMQPPLRLLLKGQPSPHLPSTMVQQPDLGTPGSGDVDDWDDKAALMVKQGLDQGLVASLLSMRGDLRGWGLGNIQETEDETLV